MIEAPSEADVTFSRTSGSHSEALSARPWHPRRWRLALEPRTQADLTTTITTTAPSSSSVQPNKLGQYHCWNRVYDPAQGRFTTPDPAASPWSDLQDYVGGNPVSRSDPSGLLGVWVPKVEWDPDGKVGFKTTASIEFEDDEEVAIQWFFNHSAIYCDGALVHLDQSFAIEWIKNDPDQAEPIADDINAQHTSKKEEDAIKAIQDRAAEKGISCKCWTIEFFMFAWRLSGSVKNGEDLKNRKFPFGQSHWETSGFSKLGYPVGSQSGSGATPEQIKGDVSADFTKRSWVWWAYRRKSGPKDCDCKVEDIKQSFGEEQTGEMPAGWHPFQIPPIVPSPFR